MSFGRKQIEAELAAIIDAANLCKADELSTADAFIKISDALKEIEHVVLTARESDE